MIFSKIIARRRACGYLIKRKPYLKAIFSCTAAGAPDSPHWKRRQQLIESRGRLVIVGFPYPTHIGLRVGRKIVVKRRLYFDSNGVASVVSAEMRSAAEGLD